MLIFKTYGHVDKKTTTYRKWQSKTLFLAIFDPRSWIVKSVFDCHLSGVDMIVFFVSDLYPRNFYTDRKQRWNDQQIVVDDSFERMSGYKYFGIVDHDEIILPYRRWTIKQMLVNRKSCLLDTRVEPPPPATIIQSIYSKPVLSGHSK